MNQYLPLTCQPDYCSRPRSPGAPARKKTNTTVKVGGATRAISAYPFFNLRKTVEGERGRKNETIPSGTDKEEWRATDGCQQERKVGRVENIIVSLASCMVWRRSQRQKRQKFADIFKLGETKRWIRM